MSKPARSFVQGANTQIIEGIDEELQSATGIPLGAAVYTPQSLVAFLQSHTDAGNAIVTTKAAWLDAIQKFEALDAQRQVVVHDLKQTVMAMFGRTSPRLASFGYAPRKVTVLTPEQKAAATAKGLATRKARGTMGPKTKLAIKGAPSTGSGGAAG